MLIQVQPGRDTLQQAVEDASPGDEVVLDDGTYTGSGGAVVEVSKSLTIRALNPLAAVLDGESLRRGVFVTSPPNETTHVLLDGLDITRGLTICYTDEDPHCDAESGRGAGVLLRGSASSAPLIVDIATCHVHDSIAGTGGGGVFVEDANVTLSSTHVYRNEGYNDRGGVAVESGNLIINASSLYANVGRGVVVDSASLYLSRSDVHSNTRGGVWVSGFRGHSPSSIINGERPAFVIEHTSVYNNGGDPGKSGSGILAAEASVAAGSHGRPLLNSCPRPPPGPGGRLVACGCTPKRTPQCSDAQLSSAEAVALRPESEASPFKIYRPRHLQLQQHRWFRVPPTPSSTPVHSPFLLAPTVRGSHTDPIACYWQLGSLIQPWYVLLGPR